MHETSQAASFKLLVFLPSKCKQEYIKELDIYEDLGPFKASSPSMEATAFLTWRKEVYNTKG